MGFSFVKRLQKPKYHVHVYDKDKNRLKLLNNLKNISLLESPSVVSRQCDLIFICVDKTENVENVVFGENGIVQNASKKKTIIVDFIYYLG